MTALTRDRATPYREGIEVEFPVAAATKIYAGSMVCINAGGYVAPAADTSGYSFAGVAMEQVDNTAGADGVMHDPAAAQRGLRVQCCGPHPGQGRGRHVRGG